MSSRRGGSSSSTSRGKNVQHNQDVGVGVEHNDDGNWKVISKKPNKNRTGTSSAKQCHNPPFSNLNLNPRPRHAHSHTHRSPAPSPYNSAVGSSQVSDPKRAPAARNHLEDSYRRPPTSIAPPLQDGWNWQSRPASHQPRDTQDSKPKDDVHKDDDIIEDDDDNSDDLDYDDDELLIDEFDSDSSEKSHNTLKKSNWFAKFFNMIDELTVEEVNDPERQWHCPACQAGPGAIDWYQGLQPLMTHAKTKGGDRMKPHRKLAELLEEELKRKGASVIPPGEAFGRWILLQDEEKDREIVWPPMVVVMNTQLEKDEYDKWLGMGNPELLEYFKFYKPAKARHSYGPQGHRGMSVLIFEASARGYFDAEQLHKKFVADRVDRNAWMSRNRILFHHGGNRLLYGYLATKEDLEVFNQHSQGKSKLKYEMQSYRDMVVNQIRQMSEDNQQLEWFKDKLLKEKSHSKAVEASFLQVSQKYHQTDHENRIILQRSKMQHEEDREEMILQEQFFTEQIKLIHESRKAKEETFERLRQEEREKVKYSSASISDATESRQRAVEVSEFIESQDREMKDYAVEKEKLTKAHEEAMNAMRKRHWEEEVALEDKFNSVLTQLKEKYSPSPRQPEEATTPP